MKYKVLLVTLVCWSVAAWGQAAGTQTGTDLAAGKDHGKTYTHEAIQWGPAPESLPAGAQLAVLEGNPREAGMFTMRLKMPDGYSIPPHSHPNWERVTVIAGTFQLGMGDKFEPAKLNSFGPGSFAYMPPQTHHFARTSGETEVQVHSQGPWAINYVNPNDDPRQQKK